MPEFCNINLLSDRIFNPVLKTILNYNNHPGVEKITQLVIDIFSNLIMLKWILNPRKDAQSTDFKST